jgi:signal transduction histidine kinase
LAPSAIRLAIKSPIKAALPIGGAGGGLLALWTADAPEPGSALRIGAFLADEFAPAPKPLGSSEGSGEAMARLDAVLRAVPQALVFIESERDSGRINAAAGRLLNLPEGPVAAVDLAAALMALRRRTSNADILEQEADRLLSGARVAVSGWHWRFDQPPGVFRVSTVPIHGDGVEGRLWVFDDISKEDSLFKEASAARDMAERANSAKADFLATMSHELRTPLNAVIGYAEVMQLGLFGKLTQKYEEYAQIIRDSGKHLLSLINDLLDLSKVDAGRMELILESADIAEDIVHPVMSLLAQEAARKGIALTASSDPGIRIVCDSLRIRQVLINIVGNAIKFTKVGGQVEVDVLSAADRVELRVTDNGVGMTPEEMTIALTPFGQIANPMVSRTAGTGLGLAVANKLIELHGGRLILSSAAGDGTVVTMVFARPRAEVFHKTY